MINANFLFSVIVLAVDPRWRTLSTCGASVRSTGHMRAVLLRMHTLRHLPRPSYVRVDGR